MTENRIHIQDNGLVLVKPKNESMVVLTKKEVCDACKKQIQKKPTPHKIEAAEMSFGNTKWCKGTTVYKCPCCGTFISYCNYCNKCGQALDWSDTE